MVSYVDTILSSPFFVMHAIFYVLLGFWIFIDAKARGSDSAAVWGVGCLIFPLLVIGYLLYRSEIGGRTEKASIVERGAGTIIIAHLNAVVLRFILSLNDVYPQFVEQPLAEVPYYLFLFILGAIPGYLLIWRNGWAQIRHRFNWASESDNTSP